MGVAGFLSLLYVVGFLLGAGGLCFAAKLNVLSLVLVEVGLYQLTPVVPRP